MRKGQSHSPETKAKIAAAKTGKLFTSEHSAKISEALKGRKKSAAHKLAISAGIKAAQAAKVTESNEPIDAQDGAEGHL